MAKTVLEKFLGNEAFKKYHESRAALKAVILAFAARPGTEFNWKKVKDTVNLFMGNENLVKVRYVGMFHHLTNHLIKAGRLVQSYDNKGKIFTALEYTVPEEDETTEVVTYKELFPQLKRNFWTEIAKIKAREVVMMATLLETMKIPGNGEKGLRAKCRGYLYGQMRALTKAGAFQVEEDKERHSKGIVYRRTSKPLKIPTMLDKYFKGKEVAADRGKDK